MNPGSPSGKPPDWVCTWPPSFESHFDSKARKDFFTFEFSLHVQISSPVSFRKLDLWLVGNFYSFYHYFSRSSLYAHALACRLRRDEPDPKYDSLMRDVCSAGPG